MILATTIGRDAEIETLLRNTIQGIHTLLIGPNGIGKTHLLLELQRRLKDTGATMHYVRRPVPARETGESIYNWLSLRANIGRPPRKIGAGTRLSEITAYIAELLALPQLVGKKLVILVDDFDQLPVLGIPIFELLSERVTLAAAARTRYKHPRFNRLFWRFEELDVKALSPDAARSLTDFALRKLGL